MIIKTLFVACGLVTASLFAVGAVNQQEPATLEAPGISPTTRYVTQAITTDGSVAQLAEAQPLLIYRIDGKITEAAKAVRQAKSEEERSKTTEKLTKLLSDDYDARLEGYDEYLNQLEAKLVEMRSKLQKRREAKDQMIKLRIKVLEAEAEDLGWPERMSGRFPSRLSTEPAKVSWGK